MKIYYQFDLDGWVTSTVKSVGRPNSSHQFTLIKYMKLALQKYDPSTREVTKHKHVFRSGGIIDSVVDTRFEKIKAEDVKPTDKGRKKMNDAAPFIKTTYGDDSEGEKEVTGREVDTRVAKIDTTRKRR